MSTPFRTIADSYLAVWNEADDARRRALVSRTWRPDARYADPLMKGDGHEGICRMIEAARAQFPGHAFALRGEPDGHGAWVRFSWSLGPREGAAIAGGTDIACMDGDGRFAQVTGFLDGQAVPA
jgi:hypothetical protein